MLYNSTFVNNGDRITILSDNRLNHNGVVYKYVYSPGEIGSLSWDNNVELIIGDIVIGWEEELPGYNKRYPDEWEQFVYMFFRSHYRGEKMYEKKELDIDIWKAWKVHYLNKRLTNMDTPWNSRKLMSTRSEIPKKSVPLLMRQSSLRNVESHE